MTILWQILLHPAASKLLAVENLFGVSSGRQASHCHAYVPGARQEFEAATFDSMYETFSFAAAAALGALYFYVLAHQADFDVRWCKGPVVELLFAPWRKELEARGARILGGQSVQQVRVDPATGRASSITAG
jgi:uncharacterized protein with NAD-binding domain and iron-sulfur cluster